MTAVGSTARRRSRACCRASPTPWATISSSSPIRRAVGPRRPAPAGAGREGRGSGPRLSLCASRGGAGRRGDDVGYFRGGAAGGDDVVRGGGGEESRVVYPSADIGVLIDELNT